MNLPLVSVLMPVFNSEKTVVESINSILNQTYQNFELLIIDDGSTDNSVNLINTISDKRISIFQNQNNEGIAFSRNKLMELAKGELLVWQDSDDVSMSKRLEKQVDFFIQNTEKEIVFSDVEFFPEKNKKYRHWGENLNHFYAQLFIQNPFVMSSCMFRNKIENSKFDEKLKHASDWKWYLDIIKIDNFGFINKKLVKLRIRKSNNQQLILKNRTADESLLEIMKVNFSKLSLNQLNDHQMIEFNNFVRKNKQLTFEMSNFIFKLLENLKPHFMKYNSYSVLLWYYLKLYRVSNLNIKLKCVWMLVNNNFNEKKQLKDYVCF